MEMKIVAKEVVENALQSAQELIVSLRKIRAARAVNQDPMEAFYTHLAERVESGEAVEKLLEEVDRGVLMKLIERGHNTSQDLAAVIKKTDGATRRLLSYRGIHLREVRAQE